MKYKIKFFGVTAVVVAVLFFAIGCLAFEPAPPPNRSIEGVWNRGDIVITISGNSGVFTQINPNTNWHRVQSNGNISIGDQKFRNITPAGHLRWNFQDLTFNHDVWTISGWENATIIMDSDGRTIRVATGGGVTNPNNVYRRVQ